MAATMKKELGRRDRKKKETRRLILKCANELFHKQGYAATTLEDIAGQAHVHKQTVLRYFGSKEEIALAFRQLALDQFKRGFWMADVWDGRSTRIPVRRPLHLLDL